MNRRWHTILLKRMLTALIFTVLLQCVTLPKALAYDLGQAEQALIEWQDRVGDFHSDLSGGKNAVSYRQLIEEWGTPADTGDHAYKLPICALPTFIWEINGWPGEDGREQGLMDCAFECARAEMLLGTEDFIEVLDQDHIFWIESGNPIASPNPIDEEILLLEGPATDPFYDADGTYFAQGRRDCIGHYEEAVNIFLDALGTEAGCEAFANQDFTNPNDELADKSLRAMGLFCRASARKARAYRELADRQYCRDYDQYDANAPVDAIQTTLLAGQAAYLEMVAIAAVMPEEGIGRLEDSKDFQTISSNLSEFEKVHSHITRGLNPFGYEKDYVEFKFDPDIAHSLGHRNNYEQMNYYLTNDRRYIGSAQESIERARGGYYYMRDRVREMEKYYNQFQQIVYGEAHEWEGVRAQYRLELASLLGYGDSTDGLDNDQNGTVDNPEEDTEPDQVSYFTNSGEIGQLVSEIEKAKLRVDRIDQQMENLQSNVQIKLNLLAELIQINEDQIRKRTGITGEITRDKVKIIKETGKIMADLAEEQTIAQAEAAKRKGFLNGITGIFSGIGAAIGKATPLGVIFSGLGGAAPGIGAWIDSTADADLARELGGIQARRERAAALERANLAFQESLGQIRLSELDARVYADRTNAEFEAEIKSLLLQRELLVIDMLIAEEDARQQTMRLSSAIKRALRLLADREQFEQRVKELERLQEFYQDPSARVLEDQLIMEAAEDFRLAARMVYLTGKAMEYEINDDFPRLDGVFKMRTVWELRDLQQDLWDKYWGTPGIQHDTQTTRTLSLRRDLLGLPPAGIDPEADVKFRNFLQQHVTGYGDLYIKFDTYLTVGTYDDPWLPPVNFFGQPSVRYNDNFPQDRWNEKIESIRVNINGMQNVDVSGVSASLTHYGTSYIRSLDAEIDEFGYITKDDVKAWDLEPRTTGRFTASVDGYLNPDVYYFNDQLVVRSAATSDWRFQIYGRGLANVEDILAISDIEIIIKSRGYPIQP